MIRIVKSLILVLLFLPATTEVSAQDENDSLYVTTTNDSMLRITNISPYFTLHVDSSLRYQLEINKPKASYYWFLKNAPVGLKINKDNGTLDFRA
ncbi:MAG: hypothetical protein ACO3BD_04005, partial [Chitinophagaceae bacterium]